MTYREKTEFAQKCAKCEYSTLKLITIDEEGEYEPEFGKTEACSRRVTRSCRICILEGVRCAEMEYCPEDTLTEEEIEERVNIFYTE